MHTSKMNTTCPWCGQENDAVTSMGQQDVPDDGSISVCVNEGCYEISFFQGGQLVAPSDEERQELLGDLEFREFYNHFLRKFTGMQFDCGCQAWNGIVQDPNGSGRWERTFVFKAHPGSEGVCEWVTQMLELAEETETEVVLMEYPETL